MTVRSSALLAMLLAVSLSLPVIGAASLAYGGKPLAAKPVAASKQVRATPRVVATRPVATKPVARALARPPAAKSFALTRAVVTPKAVKAYSLAPASTRSKALPIVKASLKGIAPAQTPAPQAPAASARVDSGAELAQLIATTGGTAGAPPTMSDAPPVGAEPAAAPATGAASAAVTQAPAAAKPEPTPAKALFGYVIAPTVEASAPVGFYAKGCLAGGQALPIDGPTWQVMRLSRNRNWGHPTLIATIEKLASEMHDQDGWTGLLIGDMSQPRGGPMISGHASHQVGLDADIWYRQMPTGKLSLTDRERMAPLFLAKDKGTSVITSSWSDDYVKLLRRAASYPEVARIFVHPAIKKQLCSLKADEANKTADFTWLHKIRPMFLHNEHFHIRLHCPAGSTTCTPQADPPADDGCGPELKTWLAMISRPVSKPAAPAPGTPTPPAVKPKPKPQVTLADLPAACSAVLSADAAPLLTRAAPEVAELPKPSPLRKAKLAQP